MPRDVCFQADVELRRVSKTDELSETGGFIEKDNLCIPAEVYKERHVFYC